MEEIPVDDNKSLIIAQINEMFEHDQEMRKRALDNKGVIESEEDDKLDSENTEKMKKIIDQIGWPKISEFDVGISNKAWLLVQHADHDVEFQEKCLNLMKGLPEGEISKHDIAYLTDRIRVNKGLPQIYGTQFQLDSKGNYGPKPIEDPEHVDERRNEIGLESLEEYKKALMRVYFKNED